MGYYENIDMDNWKENALLYYIKPQSYLNFAELNLHDKFSSDWDYYFCYSNNEDPTKVNQHHIKSLVMRYCKHKNIWRERKEIEYFKKYPSSQLKILTELKKRG